MIWSAVAYIFSQLLELIQISRMSDQDKDLEITGVAIPVRHRRSQTEPNYQAQSHRKTHTRSSGEPDEKHG